MYVQGNTQVRLCSIVAAEKQYVLHIMSLGLYP
jgi:hypothetical protein